MDSSKYNKVLEVVRQDLVSIRTGKATPAIVENILVDAYGSKMKVVELATISVSDPTTLLLTPFDLGNSEAIASAISNSNLGLTAVSDDTKVRVTVPALSEERRLEFVKLAKIKIEGGKVMIRQVRHEDMEQIAKAELDEDSKKREEKEVQTQVDKANAELDKMLSDKEKELMTV